MITLQEFHSNTIHIILILQVIFDHSLEMMFADMRLIFKEQIIHAQIEI